MRIHFEPQLRASRGKLLSGHGAGTAVHAGSFLRERRMVLDSDLLNHAPELLRILTHELFHFVWRKLDNGTRLRWDALVRAELGSPGELGWSAEWRKAALTPADSRKRTRRWREYLCESFCDSAAWYFSGAAKHPEYTLPAKLRRLRRQWFTRLLAERKLPL
ncbi:MAG: hypothetical protein K2X03_29555 [Bryobacteraceae bacterium]|nr:hypothetical protein [Bryobacteraceae bacterium]